MAEFNSWAKVFEGDDELTCKACLGYFRDPRLLSCFHSFCEDCISKRSECLHYGICNAFVLTEVRLITVSSGVVVCPLCSTDTAVGTAGTAGLLHNASIGYFIDRLQTSRSLCGKVARWRWLILQPMILQPRALLR